MTFTSLGEVCPTGQEYRVDTVIAGVPSGSCHDKYEEAWLCQAFGWFCGQKLPSPYIPAPQTEAEMTTPGAWTPEGTAVQSQEEYRKALEQYGAANPDVGGALPVGLFKAGEALKKAMSAYLPLLVIGGVVVLYVLYDKVYRAR